MECCFALSRPLIKAPINTSGEAEPRIKSEIRMTKPEIKSEIRMTKPEIKSEIRIKSGLTGVVVECWSGGSMGGAILGVAGEDDFDKTG